MNWMIRDPGSRGFVSAIVLAQMLARVGAFARRDQESVRPLHDQEMIVMKLPQAGGCHCGKIRYEVTEAPQLVYTCHCTDCQRIHGHRFLIGGRPARNGLPPYCWRTASTAAHA
jgi:hypothetical protein